MTCDFLRWRGFEHPPEYSEDLLEEAFDLFLSETIPVVDKPAVGGLVSPDQQCLELKALKMYIWSYRDEGAFHEDVTNRILQDLVASCQPRFLRLTADFNARGGLYTTVVSEYCQPGWQPPAKVDLP